MTLNSYENTSNENDNYFKSIIDYIKNYYKQLLLFILAILTIIGVEKLYLYNSLKFGSVNFIPGLPNPSPIPSQISSKKKRNKK
jgi:hypothetical protein